MAFLANFSSKLSVANRESELGQLMFTDRSTPFCCGSLLIVISVNLINVVNLSRAYIVLS